MILLVAGLAVFSQPASAELCPVTSSEGSRDQNSGIVWAECDGSTAPRPPSTSALTEEQKWGIYCEGVGILGAWQPGDVVNIYPTQALTVDDVVAEGLDPTGEYTYWSEQCLPASGTGGFTAQVVYTNTPPIPLTVLRDRALARIVVPTPTMAANPPFGDPDRFSVVRIPTWFWVEEPWTALPLELERSGFITVAVTAEPVSITLDPGDGSGPQTYGGPCAEWTVSLGPSATSTCSHEYTRSSAGETGDAYTIKAEVNWEYVWYVNNVLQPPFGGVTVPAPDITHQVGEIQAVGS